MDSPVPQQKVFRRAHAKERSRPFCLSGISLLLILRLSRWVEDKKLFGWRGRVGGFST